MTIVVNVDDLPLEQVTKQLNKLVNVIKIVELDPTPSVQRELMLIKVRADPETRSQVLETVSCSAPRCRRRPGRGHHRGDRRPRQARRPASGSSSRSASRSSCSRAWWRSAAVPAPSPTARCARLTDRALARDKPIKEKHRTVAEIFYDDDADLSSSRAGTSRSSDTAARATRTRCPCATPASTSRRAPRGLEEPARRPRTRPARRHPGGGGRGGRPDHDPRPGPPPAGALRGGRSRRTSSRATRCSSATASTSATASSQPPAGVDVAHGRAEGPGPPRPPPVRRRAAASRSSSPSRRTRPATPGRWPSPTPRASAACARAASRPPSPRRPRPTCSASRPCCAAASPS